MAEMREWGRGSKHVKDKEVKGIKMGGETELSGP